MIRLLGDADLPAVTALLAEQPVENVFVASRVAGAGLDPARLGGQVWGHHDRSGRLRALCYAGANLVPVGADEPALLAFARQAHGQGRRCSSIVGPAEQVAVLWRELSHDWGPAREVRGRQPLLVQDREPAVAPDPGVRRVRPDEVDVLLPACVAMFTEEVGVSPIGGDGGLMYRTRVAELVAAGRSFARIEDGRVLFKAEVGAATKDACQVQGVWVAPDRRGCGLSAGGMAAVVAACQADIAPVVSLYVNDFNAPARRAYDRVGFRQVGTFASILF